jgi:hypothetical protein
MLGDWKEAFTGNVTNPDGVVEAEADFSKPRVIGQATKRRKTWAFGNPARQPAP